MNMEMATMDVWLGTKICPAGSCVPTPFRVVLLGVEHCWSAMRGLALTLRLLVENTDRISRNAKKTKKYRDPCDRRTLIADFVRTKSYRPIDVCSFGKNVVPLLPPKIRVDHLQRYTSSASTKSAVKASITR